MIIGILIGYFIGMISTLIQVIRMENKHNKKFEEIMKDTK